MEKKELYLGTMGYGGGSLSLLAYVLVANSFIVSDSMIFLLLNLFAGLLLMVYTFNKQAYANTILNSFWFIVSLFGIIRLIY